MKNMKPLFIAFLSIALASCSGVVTPDDICSVDSFMPLRTGNWWIYECEERSGDGSVKRRFTDSVTVRGTLPSTTGDAYELSVVRQFDDGNSPFLFSHVAIRDGQSVKLSQLRGNHVITTSYWDMLSNECLCKPLLGLALDCNEQWTSIDTVIRGDTLPTVAPDNTIILSMIASHIRQNAVKTRITKPIEFAEFGVEPEALLIEILGTDSMYVVEPKDATMDPQYGSGATDIKTSRVFTKNVGILKEEVTFQQGWPDGSRTHLTTIYKRLVRFNVRTTP